MYKLIKNISIYFFVFCIILFIAEIFARYVIPYSGGIAKAKLWYEYRLQNPAAYKNSPYDAKKLIKEAFEIRHVQVDGNLQPLDRKGMYINIKNNKRVTTDQPINYTNKIFIFGGSTIFNSEVPDKFTIASFLQRLININYNKKYKVINYGVSGLLIEDQLRKIKQIKFNENDIVILYDGINEIYQYLYRGSFEKNIISEDRERLEKLNFFSRNYILFFDKYGGNYSFLFRRFLNPYASPKEYKYELKIKNLEAFNNNYYKNLIQIKNFSNINKIKYYHFLQPNLFQKKNKLNYEKELIDNQGLTPKGTKNAFDFFIKNKLYLDSFILESMINSKSLLNIFDNIEEPIYLDYMHINEVGNEIVAKEFYKTLKENNLL